MFHVHLRKVVAKSTFFESLKSKKKIIVTLLIDRVKLRNLVSRRLVNLFIDYSSLRLEKQRFFWCLKKLMQYSHTCTCTFTLENILTIFH